MLFSSHGPIGDQSVGDLIEPRFEVRTCWFESVAAMDLRRFDVALKTRRQQARALGQGLSKLLAQFGERARTRSPSGVGVYEGDSLRERPLGCRKRHLVTTPKRRLGLRRRDAQMQAKAEPLGQRCRALSHFDQLGALPGSGSWIIDQEQHPMVHDAPARDTPALSHERGTRPLVRIAANHVVHRISRVLST